jgi:hypothetical protein
LARKLALVDGANGSNNVLRASPMNSSIKRESVFTTSTPATSSFSRTVCGGGAAQ